MKSPAELAAMTDDELDAYFEEHAGFFPRMPEDSQYSIRLGSRALFSEDTADLKAKFLEAVRSWA